MLALALALGCSGGAQSAERGPRAVLVIESPVADAVLWVDGRYVAQLRDVRGGVAVTPGAHQIEVRHERYHAYYGEVTVAVGERRRIAVELAEVLP